MTRYPHDQPSKSDFKTFWSVFDAKQQQKKQELTQQDKDQKQ